MSEINTVSLLQQMKVMASRAEGASLGQSIGSAQLEPFSAVLKGALGQVNDLSNQADTLRTRFELGDPKVTAGEVMIAAQKSNLAFEAALRVRNKVVQAYQEIMNMPV